MKSQIVYIHSHVKSEAQASQALESFQKHGWDVSLYPGQTAKDVEDQPEFKYKIIENSRLHNFKKENYNRFLTKVSCAINHIRFWQKVVEQNEPMAFLEHDAICTQKWSNIYFKEYLILNAEYVFKPPNKLAIQQFKNWSWNSFGLADLEENFPLKYYRENLWKGYSMAPGTGAYAITPKGAKRMLKAVDTYGIDQSDFMINNHNVHMQYLNPSPVKFNNVNLSTSYGI